MARFRLIAFGFAVAFILGCPKEKPLPPHQASATPAEVGTVTPVETAPPTAQVAQPAMQTPAGPAVASPAAGTAIASSEGEVPDVRVDIMQFKRDTGGTVTLRFVLVNNSSERVGFGGHWMGDNKVGSDYYAVGGVHLIDPVNRKKYFVVRDSDQTCLCSRELSAVEAGKKANLWAKFPAPPPNVQRLTVVIPHFTPMDDVPLS